MSALTREALWSRLSQEGLVSGDIPAAAEPQSPWAVRLMLGVAGWLGACFLLGFAGTTFAFLFREADAALPAGAICCLAAYPIFRAAPRKDFVAQFGFAVSLAGQALVLFELSQHSGDPWMLTIPPFTYLLMAAVEAALAFAAPNYVHRVFTILAANICFSIATVSLGISGLATAVAAVGIALLWLDPLRMAKRPSLWEPLGYGFAIALLLQDGFLVIRGFSGTAAP